MDLFSFIKAKVPILSVVQEYTTLKPAGSYWKGICPFHSEKTPSFTVSPNREIYYCFGCHSGGDVISFVAAAENCSPKEAAFLIADRHHLTLPEELKTDKDSRSKDERSMHVATCELVMQWSIDMLAKHKPAQKYLTDRSVSEQAQQAFKLGVFPKGIAPVKQLIQLARSKGILIENLVAAHILFPSSKRSDMYFSPFEDRIIFPILSSNGECVAFGARTFVPGDERAKYINSQEHAFFSKGSTLFGLSTAKRHIQESKTAILVEGYTDCIALHDHGYKNSIATLGTACTPEHLKLLTRYAHTLIVMYDGDNAGKKAMVRLAELCWESSLDIRIATLPPEHDPASFLSAGLDLKPALENAQDVFTFFVGELTKGQQPSLQLVLQHIQEILGVIKGLKDPLKQELLLRQAATACGVSYGTMLKALQLKPQQKKDELRGVQQQRTPPTTLEKEFFAILLMAPQYLDKLTPDDLDLIYELSSISMQPLIKMYLDLYRTQKKVTMHDLLNLMSEQQKAAISRLMVNYTVTDPSEELFSTILHTFYKKQWKNLLNNVKMKLEENLEDVSPLLQHMHELRKKMIAKGVL